MPLERPELPPQPAIIKPDTRPNEELRYALRQATRVEPVSQPIYQEASEVSESIKSTTSFSELIHYLNTIGGIAGASDPGRVYSSAELIEYIDLVRNGADITIITRSQGLRDKVAELLLRDRLTQEIDHVDALQESVDEKFLLDVQSDIQHLPTIDELIRYIGQLEPITYKGVQYDTQQLANDIHTFWFEADHNIEIPDILGLPQKIEALHQKELQSIYRERHIATKAVERARNLNELFGDLAELGGIHVDATEYTLDSIIDSVNEYRSNKTPLSFPDVYGLHKKIYFLLNKEKSNMTVVNPRVPKIGLFKSIGNKFKNFFSGE